MIVAALCAYTSPLTFVVSHVSCSDREISTLRSLVLAKAFSFGRILVVLRNVCPWTTEMVV